MCRPLSFAVTCSTKAETPFKQTIRGVRGENSRCLCRKFRKRDSRSKNVVERLNILVVIRFLWNMYLPMDYKTIYATIQLPFVPEVPPSASMGVAVAGSELEVSKTMEESVAKRSIGGCQIKMVQ